MTIQKMQEKRKEAFDSIHELRENLKNEERQELSADERTKWDEANTAFDSANAEIERLEKEEQMRSQLESTSDPVNSQDGPVDPNGGVSTEDRSTQFRTALNAWAKSERSDVSDEEREAMRSFGFRGNEIRLGLPTGTYERGAEMRALSTSTGSNYVPQGFRDQLEQALLTFGDFRQYAQVMRTSGGNNMPMPTMNDTSNKGSQVSELSDQSGESGSDPSTGVVDLDAYKFVSNDAGNGPVFVSQEMMEDSAFDMSSIIPNALGMRLSRIQNEKMTTGSGTSAPNGVVTAAPIGRTATNPDSITYEDLLRLQYAVGGAYRNSAVWMLNDALLPDVRLITDSNGQYIFHPSLQEDTGDTILGKQIVTNQDMTGTIATTNDTVVFGDLSKYILREVAELRVYRLTERYRLEKDADAFVAYMRFDSDLLDAGTNPVQKLQQA